MNSKAKKELFSWIKAIAFALIIVIVCRSFIFTPSVVVGDSMFPNLKNGDRIIVSKMSKIHRFDKIVFQAPDNKDEEYVKRVIGLPGDTVEMKNDVLYVNGKKYQEHYLDNNRTTYQKLTNDFTLKELRGVSKVPKNSLFVMGDNRGVSNDSRIFGFVSKDAVVGKVKFRFWPFNKISWFK